MGFYEEISKYYDYIFPISNSTVDFIRNTAGNPPKSILDVACGTGGYSLELASLSYDMTSVDLDEKMIEALQSKAKKSGINVKFMQGDMIDLNNKFDKNVFDTVFCIGNSLVHLDNLNQINSFIKSTNHVLKNDGCLIIQVINYDRIVSKEVKSLPTICNESNGLSFERFYRYDNNQNKVYFKTVLTVDNQKYENEISLYPLMYNEATKILADNGFRNIEVFGDFLESSFQSESSYMMIITAKK